MKKNKIKFKNWNRSVRLIDTCVLMCCGLFSFFFSFSVSSCLLSLRSDSIDRFVSNPNERIQFEHLNMYNFRHNTRNIYSPP